MTTFLFHFASQIAANLAAPLALRAGGILIALALKSVFILVAAAVIAACLRRAPAAARHMVWLLALVCLLLLPVFTLWQAGLPQGMLARWTVRAPIAALPTQPAPAFSETVPAATPPTQVQVPFARHGATQMRPAPHSTWTIRANAFVLWLFPIWLAGALLFLSRLSILLVLAARIARRCQRIGEGPISGLVEGARRRLGGAPRTTLRLGREGSLPAVPMTIGFFSPTVLLPAHAEAWAQDRLEVALLHEMAHVRRRDWAWQVVAGVACALYWFNPLAWFAARRLRAESEMACDDLVLLAGAPAPDYAGHLLEIARALCGGRMGVPTAVAAVARPQIEGRLRAILDRAHSRNPITRRGLALALATVLFIMFPLGLLRFQAKAARLHPHAALAARPAFGPILAAGNAPATTTKKGNSTMPALKMLARSAKLGKTMATLAGLSLMATPTLAVGQQPNPAPAASPTPATPPATSSKPAQPTLTIIAPTAVYKPSPPDGPTQMSFPDGATITVKNTPADKAFAQSLSGLEAAAESAQSYYADSLVPGAVSLNSATHGLDINVTNVSVSALLANVCRAAGVNYTIDAGVQGLVTMSVHDLPFDVAIRTICQAANPPITYTVTDGTYNFRPRTTDASVNYDAYLPQKLVTLDLDGAPFAQALKELCQAGGASYMVQASGGAQAPVTVHLQNVPFTAALRALLSSTTPALSYTVQDGIVYVKPATTSMTLQSLSGDSSSPFYLQLNNGQPYVYTPQDWKGMPIQDRGQSTGAGGHSTP